MVSSFKILVRPFGRAFGPNQDTFLRLRCCGKAGRNKEIFVRCFSDAQENIVRSSFRHITIPEVSFHDYIFEKFGDFEENRIAIECVVSNKKVSYKQVRKMSKNLASSLQKKFNLKKGDRQSVLLPNCPEFPCIILGGSLIGVTSSPMNPLYTPVELSKQIEIVGPKIIFTDVAVWKKCSEALNQLQLKIPIVTVKMFKDDVVPPGTVNFSELVEYSTPAEYDPVTIDCDDDVVIPFSSGTSGLPKGVQLSHRNVVSNLYQMSDAATVLWRDPKDREPYVILAILPMFHIYGMMAVCFDGLRNGAELKSMPKFEAKTFIQTLFLKKVETAYLVPPLIFFLTHQPAVEEKHLQYLKVVITGAAPCGPSDILAFNKKFPNIKISQGYGMTETSPVISASHVDRLHKVGSVGHPLSLTLVKILDTNTGKALPQECVGEICIKGPQVMKGYFKQPEITKDSFDSDGFLKTGDIGYYDEDNDLFIVDRLKELIKVKGYQVAPAEIEEFLRSHPKIADAGVVGVHHVNQGEAPKAFVVLKKGVSMTEEEVIRFVEENLSDFKQLKGGVRFVKEIPKSSAGKILRKMLKELN